MEKRCEDNEVKIREFVGDLIFEMADAQKFVQVPLSQGIWTKHRLGWGGRHSVLLDECDIMRGNHL